MSLEFILKITIKPVKSLLKSDQLLSDLILCNAKILNFELEFQEDKSNQRQERDRTA